MTRPFSLLVKPAAADCNLRCRYCFYLDRAALYPDTLRHRMPDDVLEHMVRTYLATDQPQHSFGWQGGEPTLMGLDFFRKVTSFQERYGRSGRVVGNGLQTNATLIDDAFAEHLARYRFLLGVSVDGPAEVHNRFRTFVDGRGTHEAVMRGIDCLRRHSVEFNVLTLVSQANVRRPRETYRYLRDELGCLFHQYIECVEFDANGALMPFAISGAEWGDFLCGVYDEWIASGDTHRVSVRLFDSILAMDVDRVANVCCMGTDCRQYLVVEWNGDVYPCDFYVQADLRLGNILTASWDELLASPAFAEFGARKRRWNAKCDACEYLRFCGGCCPKNRPRHGADPGQLSALCDGWLQFYRHAMPGLHALGNGVRAQRAAEEQAARRERVRAAAPGSVGRNDPCPCGSGLKFKKCCGST